MPKLKLDVDALRVDSFHPAARPAVRGTVNGASATYNADCQTWENPWCGQQTNEQSCTGGCGTGGTGTGGNPTEGSTCLYASCDGYTC